MPNTEVMINYNYHKSSSCFITLYKHNFYLLFLLCFFGGSTDIPFLYSSKYSLRDVLRQNRNISSSVMFFLPACFENAISSFGKCVSNSVNTKEVSAETNSCDGTFGFSSCSHIFPTKKRRASSRLRFVSSSSISFWSIPLRNDWKDIKFQFTTFSIVYQNNKTS